MIEILKTTEDKKLIELEGNFNLKLVEMQQIDKENETKINQLINEKNELLKSNEKLSKGLLQFVTSNMVLGKVLVTRPSTSITSCFDIFKPPFHNDRSAPS